MKFFFDHALLYAEQILSVSLLVVPRDDSVPKRRTGVHIEASNDNNKETELELPTLLYIVLNDRKNL